LTFPPESSLVTAVKQRGNDGERAEISLINRWITGGKQTVNRRHENKSKKRNIEKTILDKQADNKAP
jgi:hypothetical protein